MIVTKNSRTAGCLHTDNAQVVFDGHRQSSQWARRIFCTLRRTFCINVQKCVEGIVKFLCGVDRGFYCLTRHDWSICLTLTKPSVRGSDLPPDRVLQLMPSFVPMIQQPHPHERSPSTPLPA